MKISCLLFRRQDIFLYFCTMIKNNIPLKVALGYAAVAVVMALAVALVYSNTQSILNIDKARATIPTSAIWPTAWCTACST